MKIKALLVGFVVLISIFSRPSLSYADELLDQGLKQMAKEIKDFLQEEGRPLAIVVGDFSAPPRLKASGGVELSRSIAVQLQAAGVSVSDNAAHQLMGKFKLSTKKQHTADDFESLAMEIEATVMDGNDQELVNLPISVFGSVSLQMAGQTVEIPVKLPEKERQETLIRQIKEPPTKIENAKTMPSASSPFGIEILVNSNNRLTSRSPRLDSQSRAFVELHRGEEYVVRLYNDAAFEAAVCLTVDGVDVFVDAQDAPPNSRLIIYPGRHVDVPGWYFSRTQSKAFEIGGYEESVAKRVGNSTGVGTISAAFQACWDPNGPRPADEPGGNPKGGKATKQGRDIKKNYVELTRDFGAVRAVVSVRYDR